MASTNTLEILIRANDQASRTLSNLTKSTSDSFKSLGLSMAKTGAIMAGATAPFVAGLASAVKSANAFDESMTNVGAVLGKSRSQMQALNAEVLAIGAASRAGPQAASEAFYDIVGGVADASTHMAILNAAIATAEAGSADLGGTTAALISIMNSYGFSAEEAAFASDVLTQTVGAGVGSMEEFAAAMPQVAGLASSLGIEFDALGASMAFLTTKGFSASQSATQLRAMMVAMLNPNAAMKDSLEEAGFASGQLAVEQYGLVGAYQQLNNASPTFQANMAGAVGSVEALNGVISLTDESFTQFEKDFISSAEGATDAARKIQLDSFAAQMDILNSSVEALKISIGMALLPVLVKMVRMITPIISALTTWAGENQLLIQGFGIFVGLLTAAGSSMIIFGGAVALAGVILANLPLIAVTAAATGLIMAFDYLANSTSRFAAASRMMFGVLKSGDFETLNTLFAFFTGYDVKEKFNDFIDTVSSIGSDLMPDFNFSGIASSISNALSAITMPEINLSGIASSISNALNAITLPDFDFSGVASGISTALGAIVIPQPDLSGIASGISTALSAMTLPEIDFSGITSQISTALNTILSIDPAAITGDLDFQPLVNAISENFDSVLRLSLPLMFGGGIGGLAVSAVIMAFETDFLGFRTALENSGVIASIKDGLSVIKDAISGFFGGGSDGAEIGGVSGGARTGGGGGIAGAIASIETALQPLADLLSGVWASIAPGLTDLKNGIIGFFTAFEGTETGNIPGALGDLATGLGSFLAIFIQFGADVIGSTLSAIGDFLPSLGEGLSSLVTAIDKALGGDYGGALTSLGDGIKAISDGVSGLQLDLFTGLVDALLGLVGVDLSTISTEASTLGQSILDGVVSFFANTDLGSWVTTNILSKLISAIMAADKSGIGEAALGIAGNVLNGILDGLGDFVSFVLNDIIIPLGNAIVGGAPEIATFAGDIGKQILTGILDGLVGIGQSILDAITSELGSVDIGGAIKGAVGGEVEIGGHNINPFAGKRAIGGPVKSGAPYLVGERGPELFVPSSAGRIMPNNQLGGGGSSGGGAGTSYDFSGSQFVLPNVANARDFLDDLEAEAKRRGKTILKPRTARAP